MTRYTEQWRRNVAEGVKKANALRGPISEETRQKLVNAGRKGAQLRVYTRKPLEQLKSWPKIREIVFSERGRQCEQCSWQAERKDSVVPTQIHHIDGDRTNNTRENLIVLCPNCHSLTDKFMNYAGMS